MAKILDKDKESVLIKITVSEYKVLEKLDFFSGWTDNDEGWETVADFEWWVPATDVLSYIKSLR